MYNRINFRDIDKSKNLTREESLQDNPCEDYNKFLINKAINFVKKNQPYSEVLDKLQGNTTHVHHIFPKSTHGVESDNIFNIMLLDSASNNAIGNNHPSAYLTLERFNEDAQFREILHSHFIGLDEIVDIQNNDLESFKRHRMTKIMDYISNLFD